MSRNLKRITQTMDSLTGEMVDKHVDFIANGEREPHFVKLYMQDVARLFDVQLSSLATLFEMLKTVDYENKIVLSADKKRDICKALDAKKSDKEPLTTPNTINQHLYRLCQAGLILRKGTGTFIANPKIFGKGKWHDVKQIVLQISYNDGGKEILTDIAKGGKSKNENY